MRIFYFSSPSLFDFNVDNIFMAVIDFVQISDKFLQFETIDSDANATRSENCVKISDFFPTLSGVSIQCP